MFFVLHVLYVVLYFFLCDSEEPPLKVAKLRNPKRVPQESKGKAKMEPKPSTSTGRGLGRKKGIIHNQVHSRLWV